MSARAEPRFTRDVDVCVLVDADAESERLVASMMTRDDESDVRRLAALVTERGFDRGRDLDALTDSYLNG